MTDLLGVNESAGPPPIQGVPTWIAAFAGRAAQGPVNEPVTVKGFRDFEQTFGGLWPESTLSYAVRDFFANGGAEAIIVRLNREGGAALREADFTGPGMEDTKNGLYALEKAGPFNLLCIPPHEASRDIEPGLVGAAAQYCEKKRAFLLVDAPMNWVDAGTAQSGMAGGVGTTSPNAAIYFPRLIEPNPLRRNQAEPMAPCGAVAGVMARTDARRGVWKMPAGQDATLTGVTGLSVSLTDAESGGLNVLGLNCLRAMRPGGFVVWGGRTLGGRQDPDWTYIPIRRLVLFIEESISRGTQWAVFEPNGAPLWTQLRESVSTFLMGLWRQGAFQGSKASDAFFVKCDAATVTQEDIDNGVVNMVIGIAPVKPAEFVIIRIQQRSLRR